MPVICKTFRLGVFFDGTGNNKANDLAANNARGRQQNLPQSEHEKDITEANAPSNIAKLSDVYPNGQVLEGRRTDECKIMTKMIYIEGVGTNSGEDDYATGLAGGNEGALRINQAIDKVLTALKQRGEDEYNRVIDVFGFSRGAAQARDFINTFNVRHGKNVKNFKFGFVGLYDTVGSFGLGGNDIDYKPKDPTKDSEIHPDALAFELGVSQPNSLSQNNFHNKFEEYNFNLSANSADTIVHLTAADEYRGNFPLTNVQGSGGLEAKLIGVHSDIGGGYPPLTDESELHDELRPPELSFRKPPRSRDVGDPFLLAEEGAKAKELELGKGWKCRSVITSRGGHAGKRAHVVCTQRNEITDDLQNVGLSAMHTQGLNAGVPFNALPNFDVPDDLNEYYIDTVSSPISASSYSPKKPILTFYAHRSSYDSKNVLHGRDAGGFFSDYIPNEMRYENNTPKREIYGNVPAKAVTV